MSSISGSVVCVLLIGALTGCTDESPRLSVEEGLTCASEAFKGHPGTFRQRGNTVAYSYESPNGPADVIVTFDERRRPVSTFFESAPLGSHEELMDAAQAIKNCVAYGPKARAESNKHGAMSMIGRKWGPESIGFALLFTPYLHNVIERPINPSHDFLQLSCNLHVVLQKR